MKKQFGIVVTLVVIILYIFTFAACKSCKDNEPWDYDEAIWYSENPEIEIVKKQDTYWIGYIIVNDKKINVELFWGPSYYFEIVYADFTVISDETILLRGALDFDDESATLTIEKDNVFNNKYKEIVLYRRALEQNTQSA